MSDQTASRGSKNSFLTQDPAVAGIVRRISEAFRPDRVLLFGSRARNDGDPESDLDLLVIYSGPLAKREVQLGIRRLVADPPFGMDIFVMHPVEFESQRHVANALAREAAETGVEIHG